MNENEKRIREKNNSIINDQNNDEIKFDEKSKNINEDKAKRVKSISNVSINSFFF